MALRPFAWLCLLAAGAAEGPAPALRGLPAAPSAAAAAAGAAPSNDTVLEVECMCEVATGECACTRADPARSLTAEDAETERTLTARAKALSAWWAAQAATTRLTREWSGPMVPQTAETEAVLPSLDETTALWRRGWRRGGCGRSSACGCAWGACGCARRGGCSWR